MTLKTGLQICFTLDEVSGNRIDVVSGLALIPSGVVTGSPGKFANAVDLQPGSYLGESSNSAIAAGTGPFTFSCWVKYRSIGPQQASYPMARWDGLGDWVFVVNVSAACSATVRISDNTTNASATTPANTIKTDRWHMLTGWYDNLQTAFGTVYLQVDNGQIYSAALPHFKASNASARLCLGRINPTAGPFGSTDGQIEQACKWSRVLSNEERNKLWNNGVGLAYPFGGVPLINGGLINHSLIGRSLIR